MNFIKQKKNYQIIRFKPLERQEGFTKIDNVNIYFEFLNKSLLAEAQAIIGFPSRRIGSIAQWKDFPALLSEKTKCPGIAVRSRRTWKIR